MNKYTSVLVLFVLLSTVTAFSATKTTVASGNWSNTATWGGTLPASNDDIVIADGTTLTVNGNYTCRSISFGVIGPSAAAGLIVNFTLTVTNGVELSP